MTYQTYNDYKNSGIEWLGKVPVAWEVCRLRETTFMRTSNVDKKNEENEIPVKLCNYVDVYYNEKINSNIAFMKATATEHEISKFKLFKGDVVLTKDSESPFDIGIPTLIDENIDDLICGYHLAILKPKNNKTHGAYLYYAIKSKPSASQFSIYANGVTRFGISQEGLKSLVLVIPPLLEQKAIADFLDKKTAEIDALIEKKQQLLKLLSEKRTALITHAVTKGLDKSAPLKDSGIEWLGKVPVGWEITSIRRITKNVQTGGTPPTGDVNYFEDGDFSWYTPSDFWDGIELFDSNRKVNRFTISDKVIKVFPKNTIYVVGIGTIGSVGISRQEASANQQINAIIAKETVYPKFLAYSLLVQKQQMVAIANATIIGIMNQEKTKQIIICNPPLSSQKSIADFLDTKTADIDRTKEKVEQVIKTLKEYRTALITNAVTGKIKVI